jgi:hypothetical protein
MNAPIQKSIQFAYPTSPAAERLGYGETGCYYLAKETLSEGIYWESVWPGSEGEACAPGDSEGLQALRDLYAEHDVPVSPYCKLVHGEVK